MGSRRYEAGSELDVEKEIADKLVKNGLAYYLGSVLEISQDGNYVKFEGHVEKPIVSYEAEKEIPKEEVQKAPKKRGRKKK